MQRICICNPQCLKTDIDTAVFVEWCLFNIFVARTLVIIAVQLLTLCTLRFTVKMSLDCCIIWLCQSWSHHNWQPPFPPTQIPRVKIKNNRNLKQQNTDVLPYWQWHGAGCMQVQTRPDIPWYLRVAQSSVHRSWNLWPVRKKKKKIRRGTYEKDRK